MSTRGLVLGGGGITGIAWETGLAAGLLELGVDLGDADLVVGTSAGSVVGAQLRSGTPVTELYARQISTPVPAPTPSFGLSVLLGFASAALLSRGDPERMGRRLGAWAVKRAAAGRTPTLAARLDAIRARLTSLEWPERSLLVTAVEAGLGELRVFDGTDGTSLLDAVAASCAVPGVYPPVPIGAQTYVDGGARSGTNADLAAHCDAVLVLAPIDRSRGPMRSATQQLGDTRHVVLTPDAASRTAIGNNVLAVSARPASARAGFAQAAAVADEVRALWAR
ncbi:MAG: patatin-like phospholipase family protein [Nocardioides sp.]|nr:patatin-like phospholipase family protein [Nocardioides sp.]